MSAEESSRFCCGACEHVARASERKTGYTPRTCELRVTGDGAVYIADLESACGTVVNDTRIAAPYRLHERDAIRIGNTFLMFAHRLPA
jgi:hypothetical protein